MAFAQNTTVAPERSRAEIERMLAAHGASSFLYAVNPNGAVIGFEIARRSVRIELPTPSPDRFRVTPQGRTRSPAAVDEAFAQEIRRRWRSLALVIKAKLTAVEDGISTIEREFLADVVLANGRTVGVELRAQLETSRKLGAPLCLPSHLENNET